MGLVGQGGGHGEFDRYRGAQLHKIASIIIAWNRRIGRAWEAISLEGERRDLAETVVTAGDNGDSDLGPDVGALMPQGKVDRSCRRIQHVYGHVE